MRLLPLIVSSTLLAATCAGCASSPQSSDESPCSASDLKVTLASVQYDDAQKRRDLQFSVVSHRNCVLREPAHLEIQGTQGWKPMETVPYNGSATPPSSLPTTITPSGPTVVVDLGYTEPKQLATCTTDARVIVNGAFAALKLGCWQPDFSLSGPGEGAILPTTPGQEMWLHS